MSRRRLTSPRSSRSVRGSPVWAAAASAIVFGAVFARRQCSWINVGFNSANAAIAVAAGGLTYQAVAVAVLGDGHSLSAVALVCAGAAYLGANVGGLGGIVYFANRQESLTRWFIRWTGALPQYLGLLVLCSRRVVYVKSPLATLVLLVPLLIMYYTLSLSMRIRGETRQAIEALAREIDQRSMYTAEHSTRVAAYAEKMALALGLPPDQVDLIARTASIHDIGKLFLPASIIQKAGPLDRDEWEMMKTHPTQGARLVEGFADYRDGKGTLILYHHERPDGRGYPAGLVGEHILFGARLLAVADSYDAMTSDRPYRKGMTPARAIAELRLHRDTQFDARMVEALAGVVAGGPIVLPSNGSCEIAPTTAKAAAVSAN